MEASHSRTQQIRRQNWALSVCLWLAGPDLEEGLYLKKISLSADMA